MKKLEQSVELLITNAFASTSDENVKRFVILTHVEHAFTEFLATGKTKREEVTPQTWIVDHKQDDQEITTSLTSVFGYLPEPAQQTATHATGTDIVVRSRATELAKDLNLSEFV